MLLNIFPTPIEKIENFLNKNDIENIVLRVKNLPYTHHDSITGDGKSSHYGFSNFIEGTDLEKKINEAIAKYCAVCGYVNNKISYSWANIQKKDSILKMHNHGGDLISGALFLKTDRQSSKLCFENPNPYSKVIDWNVLSTICFDAQIGDLFIFPGWLIHGSNYESNKSNERIVLSFNCEKVI